MKIIRNTGALLMIAIFLIPAAGLYYNRHSCHKTGEVQFVLDKEYSCCAVPVEYHFEVLSSSSASSSSAACCNAEAECAEPGINSKEEGSISKSAIPPGHHEITDGDKNCCLNEGQYLKSEEKYPVPTKAKKPHIETCITIAAILANPLPPRNTSIEQNAHSPPLPISSKNLLLRNGVMLI